MPRFLTLSAAWLAVFLPVVSLQAADQPADDDRYFGEYPKGSKGGGYADMRAAKPLA